MTKKKQPDRIKKGDVVAMVLAKADCDTPLFIGLASRPGDAVNTAHFAGTCFFDDPFTKLKAVKVPYDDYHQSYNFGCKSEKTYTKLGNVAITRGYVWVYTVIPVNRFI